MFLKRLDILKEVFNVLLSSDPVLFVHLGSYQKPHSHGQDKMQFYPVHKSMRAVERSRNSTHA